ncbi:MAG: hypothetical protein JWM11_2741 [Planctomycetaceae bacterium]|nr:hypothetical protein [Planctomycetaceae bacterium]
MIKSQCPKGRLTYWVCCVALSLGLTGCGSSGPAADPNLVSVTGNVTIDGKPLKTGEISFVSADTPGVGFGGKIDSSGNYVLMHTATAKGAVPGNYKVRFSALDGIPTMGEKGELSKPKSLIPEKYNSPETSGETATVEKGKALVKNFALKSM